MLWNLIAIYLRHTKFKAKGVLLQFSNYVLMHCNCVPLSYRAETSKETHKARQQGSVYHARCGDKSTGGPFRGLHVIINVLGWCSIVGLFHIVLREIESVAKFGDNWFWIGSAYPKRKWDINWYASLWKAWMLKRSHYAVHPSSSKVSKT